MTKEQELNDLLSVDNPFGCGHARRFIWRDPAGVKACAACRMFVAEKMERETISRTEVAAALDDLHAEFDAAIRVAIDLQNVPAASLGGYWRDRLDATIAALGLPEPAACTWTPDEDGVYNTSCDHAFFFEIGTPAENNIAFCGYCGKRLVEGVSE